MMLKVYFTTKRIPKWTTEKPRADRAIAEFMESVIRAMELQGRARNLKIHRIQGGFEYEFERRESLKFKRVRID